MAWHRLAFAWVLGSLASAWAATAWADAPTAQQALTLKPVQKYVDYTRPSKEDAAKCTIRAEKEGGMTAWVVRDPEGRVLRRFADTNKDNVVDLWCYYRDGLEVYRDIDADSNGKADQYRWFNTGGTRWGIDRNEDGQIDVWRVIAPQEVAEELVLALRTRDRARFDLLLLSSLELGELGLGENRSKNLSESISSALGRFAQFTAEQKAVTPKSRYVDFAGFRPSTIPAGTDGSTKDVTIQDNVSALVDTGGKNEQLYLGTLVKVGDTWKLLDLPALDSDEQSTAGSFLLASSATSGTGSSAGQEAPSQEMQQLMTSLEALDRQAEGMAPDKQAPITEKRAELLSRLAKMTTDPELREQWYRQLADMISVAVHAGGFPQGLDRLEELQEQLTKADADDELIAHVEFQRMWATYALSQQQPGVDGAKIQEQWLADLEAFLKKYPKSSDAAEAMLQLGMYQEFIGRSEPAQVWYEKLVTAFPDSEPAAKADGAIRRLTSVGKPIRLRGPGVQGGTVDLSSYRGKLVLIQYWATWCEPCVQDMERIKELYQKYGGRNFEIIGVSLDESPATVRKFLAENRFPWKQIHEPGGLDSRLADEMGVMTLPLMVLVDQKGNVIDHSVFVAELEAELKRLSE